MSNASENEKHKFQINQVKTIIIGADLTEESKDLVEQGQRLAQFWRAKLVVAHVMPLFDLDPSIEFNFATTMPWEDIQGEKEKEIRSFYGLSSCSGADVEIKFGRPEDEIEALAQKYPNPLILVGHSTKGWFEKLFTGSTSKGLATRFQTPVLIY